MQKYPRKLKLVLYSLLVLVIIGIVIYGKKYQTFHLSASASTNLLTQYNLIYGSEIGAWETNGKPAVDTTTSIPGEVTGANIPVIRYAVYDCFSDETCGRDNHTGSLSRASFDNAINGIVNNLHALPWIKLLPVAKGAIGSVSNGSIFCPATTNWGMNLPMYEDLMNEIHKEYTGPIIIESSNEAEYDCYSYWGFASAGAVGVSKNIGDMYNATMPPLVKYARDTLGFSQVVTVGYIGIGGGTGWGQTCTASGSATYGYNCTYQKRWIDEFNNEVEANYATHSADTDYIPNVESIHNYCHSTDFGSNPFTFDDNICFAFFRNWITQSRSELNSIWGSTIGNSIRFAMSEWNAGVCTNLATNCWSGWSTPSSVQSYYSGWLGMLQGDGNTTGTGTRYWAANVFEIASNSDSSPGGYYNIIHQDGTTPAWYTTFKNASLSDPLANPASVSTTSTNTTNSSGVGSNINCHSEWIYCIDSGPNLNGITSYISGFGEASAALTFISNLAVPFDVHVVITKQHPSDLLNASIPFPWQQGFNTATEFYQYQALSSFNGYPLTQFNSPVTIILPYDASKLHGLPVSKLGIGWYNSVSKKWSLLNTKYVVNIQNNTIATTVKQYSYFVVIYP